MLLFGGLPPAPNVDSPNNIPQVIQEITRPSTRHWGWREKSFVCVCFFNFFPIFVYFYFGEVLLKISFLHFLCAFFPGKKTINQNSSYWRGSKYPPKKLLGFQIYSSQCLVPTIEIRMWSMCFLCIIWAVFTKTAYCTFIVYTDLPIQVLVNPLRAALYFQKLLLR